MISTLYFLFIYYDTLFACLLIRKIHKILLKNQKWSAIIKKENVEIIFLYDIEELELFHHSKLSSYLSVSLICNHLNHRRGSIFFLLLVFFFFLLVVGTEWNKHIPWPCRNGRILGICNSLNSVSQHITYPFWTFR